MILKELMEFAAPSSSLFVVCLNDMGEWAAGPTAYASQLFDTLGIKKNYNVSSFEELFKQQGGPFASFGDDFIYFAVAPSVASAKEELIKFAHGQNDSNASFTQQVSFDDVAQGGGGY